MRLSTRIALVVGAVVPLLVLASGWLLVDLVGRDLHAQADQRLAERAHGVAAAARGLLRAASQDRPRAEHARQRKLFSAALDVGIRLEGPDRTVQEGPQPDPSVRLPTVPGKPVSVHARGETWRVLAERVTGKAPGVRGTVWLFSPDSVNQAQIGLVRGRVITVALLAAPASAGLAWALAAGAARPLRRLQQRTSGLDPRTSDVRLEHRPTRITEVDDLAHTVQTVLTRYDEQAARTAEALATARSFSAAASHELRTPLTSMQTSLDILDAFQELDAQDRAETVEDLRRGHARLLALLVMLRALAQGDLVEADAFASVDLADLMDVAVADFRRAHPDAEVGLECTTGLVVHGWQPGLRSLVDNLLANALAHGRSADGRARIAVALRGADEDGAPVAVLTVDDQGPGVPPEERQTIFERFRRRADSPGSGLGLTLVAQQAGLHRARLEVRTAPGGRGARLEVAFPLTRPGPDGPAEPHWDWLSDTHDLRQEIHKNRS
ncbi:HAMP domain-containing histidine kinase (plasmid) [Streptomyces sp. BHT-5-2]|uniref:sensor histidine kinase n=1 Tax=unclassified Streptomyces TaxID=2593676 RepID=UPI001C8D6B57|nr:HAMP domain-containing sensor histidine kinase [Streptomyces sp. BHT-5-2]QZL07958.1 HAMP domain-containing histidine kinase [Streptomyces sp. BHT-5-2]